MSQLSSPRFSGMAVYLKPPPMFNPQQPTGSRAVAVVGPQHRVCAENPDGFYFNGHLLATLDRTVVLPYDHLMTALEERTGFDQVQHPSRIRRVVEFVRRALVGQTVPGVTVNPKVDKAEAEIFFAWGIPAIEDVLTNGQRMDQSRAADPVNREMTYFQLDDEVPDGAT